MSFTVGKFFELNPKLYHMSAEGAWPVIQRHGLLSTTAVLDKAEIDGRRRTDLESRRRLQSTIVEVGHDRFVLRDPKPS